MDKKRLQAALDQALIAAPPPDAPSYKLTLLLQVADTEPTKADQRIVSLLEALRAEPELGIFNGMMQIIPWGANRQEYQTLAAWLMTRSRQVSSGEAVEDVAKYLEIKEVPCELTLALSGLKPEAICDLGRGVSFVPWDGIEESPQKKSTSERFKTGWPSQQPSGALIRKFSLEKLHIHQDDYEGAMEKRKVTQVDNTELYDALMCLSLLRPSAPHVVASWIYVPTWVPMIAYNMTLPGLEGYPPLHTFPADACNEGRDLFIAFCNLRSKFKARLRLSMQRLTRAMRRGEPVDAAIDLGIALETLFLSDIVKDRGELNFRLRTRAARFLGRNESERKRFFELFGDIYTIRSIAVHTGALPTDFKGRRVQEILNDGFVFTANTVKCFITSGEPNWDSVMFN